VKTYEKVRKGYIFDEKKKGPGGNAPKEGNLLRQAREGLLTDAEEQRPVTKIRSEGPIR